MGTVAPFNRWWKPGLQGLKVTRDTQGLAAGSRSNTGLGDRTCEIQSGARLLASAAFWVSVF